MGPIEVLVIAKSGTRVCSSCANGRTWEEVAMSLGRQLHRSFGESVVCRFVDCQAVDDDRVARLLSAGLDRVRMPLVLIDGEIHSGGAFSPTFIRREVARTLAKRTRRSVAVVRNTLRRQHLQDRGVVGWSQAQRSV